MKEFSPSGEKILSFKSNTFDSSGEHILSFKINIYEKELKHLGKKKKLCRNCLPLRRELILLKLECLLFEGYLDTLLINFES